MVFSRNLRALTSPYTFALALALGLVSTTRRATGCTLLLLGVLRRWDDMRWWIFTFPTTPRLPAEFGTDHLVRMYTSRLHPLSYRLHLAEPLLVCLCGTNPLFYWFECPLILHLFRFLRAGSIQFSNRTIVILQRFPHWWYGFGFSYLALLPLYVFHSALLVRAQTAFLIIFSILVFHH